MQHLTIAESLKKECDYILSELGIEQTLKKYSKAFHKTGSYTLDLMAWNDLDLYIEVEEKDKIEIYNKIINELSKLANHHNIDMRTVRLEYKVNEEEKYHHLPDGDYIQLKFHFKNKRYKLPWKIDIWSLSEQRINEVQNKQEQIKNKLTKESRDLILHTKQAVILSKGRTPSLSGVHIYDAVLEHNMQDINSIIDYLKEKGIKLEQK